MLLSLIAFIFSLLIAVLLMPVFEQVSGKQFTFSTEHYVWLIAGFLGVTLFAGLISGMYPAFYLSAFQPIKVLKGKYSNSLSAVSLRKVLVVFQFVISVALIVASVTITNQMRFLRDKDLGFQKEQQVVIPLRTSTAKAIYPTFKNQLLANPAISSAGASIYYPGIQNVTDWLLYKQGNPTDDTKQMFMNFVDDGYLQTLGVRQVAGRIFSKEFPADTANRLVINEQAVKSFGFASAEEAIGKNIAATRNGQEVLFPIVGVVKDFHFEGMHSAIESYGFLLRSEPTFTYLIAHVKGGNIQTTLGNIEATWLKLNPNEPFEYSFLDEDFQKNYLAEERLAAIIRYFTIIAIFISCLGLFGLATFSAEHRTKEIGIRKVLGANVAGIVALLSKEFLVLIGVAVIIASPIAWYAMNRWLQDFAYRINVSWQIFAVTILLVAFIAFVTISVQAIKAALSNPVKSLRTE
jgi:putative ABC transport system permease protein